MQNLTRLKAACIVVWQRLHRLCTAYLQRGTNNIIILDWSALAFGNYVAVTLRIKDVAKFTAEALSKLVAKGLDVNTLHVIGHSMGAQIGGFIGRYLDFTIPRVSGTLVTILLDFNYSLTKNSIIIFNVMHAHCT